MNKIAEDSYKLLEKERIQKLANQCINAIEHDIKNKLCRNETIVIDMKHYVMNYLDVDYFNDESKIIIMGDVHAICKNQADIVDLWYYYPAAHWPYVRVSGESLPSKSIFHGGKTCVSISEQEKLFRDIVKNSLKSKGIVFKGGFVITENKKSSKSNCTIKYDDEIIVNSRRNTVNMIYKYEFWC